MTMKNWDDAKEELRRSEKYIAMIGEPQKTTAKGVVGTLHDVSAATKIHYQPYDGATNYHNCPEFDAALNDAIKAKFPELMSDAMGLLRDAVAETGKKARDDIESMLSQIDEYEE